MSVLIETSFGDITIDLFIKKAPIASTNFLKLCKIKFFNNALFAEVQKDYVTKIVTPKASTIWSECGQKAPFFKDEIDVESKVNEIGLIVTANKGANLNNSEFFITLTRANIVSLTGKHTIFGKVEEGLDVLKKISDTYVDSYQRPQMNIRILHTFVLEDPFPDIEKMRIPERSPSPVRNAERLEAIEHLQMLEKCRTENEIIQATKEQKAKKQAMTLEILGDLPDASLKPPENILFVCKLNPITQQKDLEIIFSRFGPVKSVEIVRDWKTGQSLQYGFIEFQGITACQQAYLKMNNVVIDDRRIQVDFSQSVSKLLHRNHKGSILAPKSKHQDQGRKREVLPKGITQGKDRRPKYDLVIPSLPRQQQSKPQNPSNRGADLQRPIKQKKKHKQSRRDRSRSDSRKKKSKRSSSSSQRNKRDRKRKHRYVSESQSR